MTNNGDLGVLSSLLHLSLPLSIGGGAEHLAAVWRSGDVDMS
jgi:hypothetical protein